MYKKTVTYVDYDGNERSEDLWFNMNEAELTKWLMTNGDYTLDKVMLKLTTERNGKKIIEYFEDFIHRSYGRKSLDGRRFEKSEEIWNDFYQTEAYSILFMEIISDGKAAADFMNAVIPKSLSDKVKETILKNPDGIPDELKDYVGDVAKH